MLSKDKTELNHEEEDKSPEEVTNQTPTDSPEETLPEDATPPEAEPEVAEESETPVSEETPVEETAAPEEAAEETPVAEAQPETQEETPSEEPAPEAEEVAETPVVEAEAPATEEAESPEAEATEEATEEVAEEPAKQEEASPVAETPAAEAEESAEATEEAPASEEEAPAEEAAPEDEGEISEESMLKQIEEVLNNAPDFEQLANSSSPQELILMLDFFYKSQEVRPHIRKVGMIKRAYDALNSAAEPLSAAVQGKFSMALSRFNKKRAEYQAQQEVEKAANSAKKKELVARLQEIVDSQDMSHYEKVKSIQDNWKSIGHVLREDMEELNSKYRSLLDNYYKQREIYFQLRDYDRQINLQEKEKLLVELAGIMPAEEEQEDREVWQAKNDLLTDIQLRWRATGHVPREDMDRINQEYRRITEEFFSLRHEFYETQDQARQENADAKRELLDKMKEFLEFSSKNPRDWNEATDKLRAMQEEWKKVGRAPKEVNSELWKEYRSIGNAFFGAKAEFFKDLDSVRNTNLEMKKELVEKVEALRESTEWEKTAKELKKIQDQWKSIGPVPDRHSNKLWARFRKACDAFFEGRRKHYEVLREGEVENLKQKQALIEEVTKVSVEEAGSPEAAIEQIKAIQARWKEVGRVPYKDKDTIWKAFRKEIDQFFNDLRGNRDRTNYAKLKSSVNNLTDDKRTRTLKGKIAKLNRKMDALRGKIESYSTNILYISKGKSGDALRQQIQGEIEKEQRLLDDLRKQMKQLRELLTNPPKEEKKQEKAAEAEAKTEAPEAKEAAEPAKEEVEAPAAEEKTEEEAPAAEETPEAEAPAEEAPAAEAEETPTAEAEEATEATEEEAPEAKAEESPAEEAAEPETSEEEEKKE